MQSSKVEFLFLKSSMMQFVKDLRKMDDPIQDKTFSTEETVGMMAYLMVVKESKYCSAGK